MDKHLACKECGGTEFYVASSFGVIEENFKPSIWSSMKTPYVGEKRVTIGDNCIRIIQTDKLICKICGGMSLIVVKKSEG